MKRIMPVKYFAHPAFGDIALKKNKLSKGLRIIIRSSSSITVTFPWHLSYHEAIRFVLDKEEWIAKSLKKTEGDVKNRVLLPGDQFSTFAHELTFEKLLSGKPYIKVDKTRIIVCYLDENDLKYPEIQAHLRMAIEKVLRMEANKYLPPRVDFFANKHQLTYKHISLKKMKTRWGSCSTSGNLNFNIHLMRLPQHLIDYVILHELAHTKHHNHGAGFWKFLDELTGNKARTLSEEMKNYRTTAY